MNIKEIKQKIRELRKIKKETQKKSSLRRDLNKQIRELKKQLSFLDENITDEKKDIIEKIYKLKPIFKRLNIDLRKFTIEELQYHYNKVTKGE